MAFVAANFSNMAVGPVNVYSYKTGDTLTTGTGITYFNSTVCFGLRANDIIFAQHQTAATAATGLIIMAITKITADGVSVVSINGG
uniref:Uncharacterized protein n=1 Tax=viral metagenome TaxID=1070528 RepID=A0A6M3IVI8_9ZZZZ